MPTRDSLEPGKFYWVKPVFDADFTPPGFEGYECSDVLFDASWNHWSQNDQPALFHGWDKNGNERWIFLGQDVDETNWWPVCWIGNEITK